MNLLLVSRCQVWTNAVRNAVGGRAADLVTCGAPEAVTRLAGMAPHYTHLLVRDRDADGLTSTLAGMTQEIANPGTSMFLLGDAAGNLAAPVPVIHSAEPSIVEKALLTTGPRKRQDFTVAPDDLKVALDRGSIEVRYQPIVRIGDRHPVALEALARLVHPTLGTLPPDQFVPQIEAAGLARRFTELVSAHVMADFTGPGLAGTGLRVAVNFTLDVLLCPDAMAVLEYQRTAAGVPADRLVIELTESQPVHDVAALRTAVTRLRSLGYGVAIDDVGPAVPHLWPLLDLPFTSLKLDKVLVREADRSTDVLAYLADTVRDARRHDLAVVAEGVETESICEHMAAIGVTDIQGFLAARPLPRTAVPVWLKAWTGAQA